MKIDNQPITNQCLVTRDSIFLACDQSQAFQKHFILLLGSLLLATLLNPYFSIGVLILFIVVRNPFTLKIDYMRGIGPQYRFHFSIPFRHFSLFCVNGRCFGLSGDLNEDLLDKLAEFKGYHD